MKTGHREVAGFLSLSKWRCMPQENDYLISNLPAQRQLFDPVSPINSACSHAVEIVLAEELVYPNKMPVISLAADNGH